MQKNKGRVLQKNKLENNKSPINKNERSLNLLYELVIKKDMKENLINSNKTNKYFCRSDSHPFQEAKSDHQY